MTHRGSLVYYLSAWILGCFFMSASVWLSFGSAGGFKTEPALDQVSGLLFFYFYGLEFGALPALVFAFMLRKIAAILKCKTPWHWAIFGAILSPLLLVTLGKLGLRFGSVTGNGWQPVDWFTSGPQLVLVLGWWLAIPVGAITAFLLSRIQRAFDPARVYAAGANQPSA